MNVAPTAASILILMASISFAQEPLRLTQNNYQAWMKHIQPTDAELKWNQIDWQPDLQSGIQLAAEQGKPILLWTMNGHPFGCT